MRIAGRSLILLVLIALTATACRASTEITQAPDIAPLDAAPEPTTPDGPEPTPVAVETTDPEPTAAAEPTAEPEPTATPAPSTPPETEELIWERCPGGECANMTVPLDYDEPDGETIQVAVSRAQAQDQQGRIGALFLNFGGPGGESTSLFPGVAGFIGATFPQFDIVLWDPRGVGETERLACDNALEPGFPVIEIDPSDGFADELVEQEADFAKIVECAFDTGSIADHVGTENVARDMNQIRMALGEEKVNYLGFSYGTQLGWVYATLFGDSVRSMILDGAVPGGAIDGADFVTQLAAFQRTYDYFDEVCDRTEACTLAEEGLDETVESVAAQLRDEPIEQGDGQVIGESEFRQAVLFSLYQRPEISGPVLVRAIASAQDGNGLGIAGILESGSGGITPGAYQAVLCADGGEFPGTAGQEAEFAETFAASSTFGSLGETVRCDLWPGEVDELPVLDTAAAPTILVIGSTLDPATPYEDAILLDDQLADSVLLTVEGGGHTAVFDNPCATDYAVRYFEDLTVPEPDIVCATSGLVGVDIRDVDNELVVNSVLTDSPADVAGVTSGDVIVSIDGTAIQSVADLPTLTPERALDWVIRRGTEEITFSLTPDRRPWT